jgi:hypothetical protein
MGRNSNSICAGDLRKTMDLPPDSSDEEIAPTTELPPLDFTSDEGLLGFSRENAPGSFIAFR